MANKDGSKICWKALDRAFATSIFYAYSWESEWDVTGFCYLNCFAFAISSFKNGFFSVAPSTLRDILKVVEIRENLYNLQKGISGNYKCRSTLDIWSSQMENTNNRIENFHFTPLKEQSTQFTSNAILVDIGDCIIENTWGKLQKRSKQS